MLESNGPSTGGIEAKECKPNYEQMIETEKKRLDSNLKLQDALKDYNGLHFRNKMAELLGELVSFQWQSERRVEALIANLAKSDQ